MRRLPALLIPMILLLSFDAAAVVQPQKLLLDPDAASEAVACRIASEVGEPLRLEFTLPALDLEEIAVAGEVYQALSISGGGMRGETGQAGLPSYSRLLAVPAGSVARATVISRADQALPGYRVLPVQPDGAEDFVIDRDWYAAGVAAAPPAVELGDVAYIRDQAVLPLTINPVSWDPATGELRVATQLEIEVELVGASALTDDSARRFIPESFDRLFSDVLLGYQRGDAEVGPGTYLMICPNNSGVTSRLSNLLDWRRRQGYNVILATTAQTGTTTGSILNYIQSTYNTVDPPLEHVVLAGDANGSYSIPCWYENLSWYDGEGDHYYTNLEGGDVLSDVHIGRLSFRDYGTLEDIVDKIVTYESDPPMGDAGWFTRAGLAGDQYTQSGITTVYVNQWVKQHLLAHNYTQVDTMWAPNATQMRNSINQGLSVFGYRGYLNMSGMSTGYITGLTNGYKLPYAIIVTCDTGSFSEQQTCRSEAFLRAANGGGIGSVGTATWGTHTRYNNCYYQGSWDGVINGSDHRLGPSHTRGKLELYNNYQLSQPNTVEIWCVWNNLMGDPATPMWMAYPADLDVTHPAELAVGANSVALNVSSSGLPVEGAGVALYKDGELRVTGYTDAAGAANLPIAGYGAGELLVTVTKHNFMPYLGSLDLGSLPVFAAYEASIVDDDGSGGSLGNGNGVVNPGETIELPVALHNYGSGTATDVSATITSSDPFVSIIDDVESYPDIPAGATVWSAEDFDFAVAAGTPDGHVIALDLEVTSGFQSWTSLIELTVVSAAFEQEDFSWGGSGSMLDPGESGSFSVLIRNVGTSSSGGALAVLQTDSPWVDVTDPFGTYALIAPGSTGENLDDTFALDIASDCFEGHQAAFQLTLIYGDGAQATAEFSLPVGSTSTGDPIGPDGYGYYAFDNSDSAYPQAPVYDWVEIAPNHGGSGTSVGLTDNGWEQDDTNILPLPFTFRYYGQDYNEISICSNGWAALGASGLVHYRNWSIPSSGSPNAMIAPFWDNLYQSGNDKVYYWHDTANHRYVVQWSRLRNQHNGSTENFEMILYDPVYHPTATGDGEIVFQYSTIYNVDSTNGYGTVGIQNQDRSDGLLYTYWNQYPAGAASLSSGRAIRVLTVTSQLEPTCDASPEEFVRVMAPNETTTGWLQLSNGGDPGSILSYQVGAGELPSGGPGGGPLAGRGVDWLQIQDGAGDVPQGGTDDVQITFDSSGLEEGTYEALLLVASNAAEPVFVPVTLIVDGTGTGAEQAPTVFALGQNHPNPFNPRTEIRFALPADGEARLAIYDLSGRRVRTLVEGSLPAGTHHVVWDGTDDAGQALASGVYFYRLETAAQTLSRKMLLLK